MSNVLSTVGSCGGNYSGPSGSFASPNYPGRYPAGNICKYNIEVPPGKTISLTFIYFDVEDAPSCNFDFIRVSILTIITLFQLLYIITLIQRT